MPDARLVWARSWSRKREWCNKKRPPAEAGGAYNQYIFLAYQADPVAVAAKLMIVDEILTDELLKKSIFSVAVMSRSGDKGAPLAWMTANGLDESAVGEGAPLLLDVLAVDELMVSVYWTVTAPEGLLPEAIVPEEPGDWTRLTDQPVEVTPKVTLATEAPVPEVANALND